VRNRLNRPNSLRPPRQIEHALLSSLKLDDVLGRLFDAVESLFSGEIVAALQWLKPDGVNCETIGCRNFDLDLWKCFHDAPSPGENSSLARQVLAGDAPVRIARLDDPRIERRDFYREHGLLSYLGMRLGGADPPLGALEILSRTPRRFSGRQINSIAALSSSAAIAVQNARLHAEVEKNYRALSALFAVTSAASRSLEMDRVLQRVIDKVAEIFGFDEIRAFLFDERQNLLIQRACFPIRADFAAAKQVRKGQGIVGRVGATGAALVFADIDRDPRYAEMTFNHTARALQRRFLAAFPIKHQDEPLGVIACLRREPRPLAPHERELLDSIWDQIAVSIHNARLYAAMEKQSRELSALFDVTATVSETLEQSRVLKEVTQKITEIFGFDATRAFVFDERRAELRRAASYELRAEFAGGPKRIGKGQGLTGTVALTGSAIIVDDVKKAAETAAAWQPASEREVRHRHRFLAAFPIKYKQATLGAILCVAEEPRQLSVHEVLLISAMCNQIAIALQNSRYFEQSQRQAARLRQYALRREAVLEQERTRIAREFHDELGQALTALKIELSVAAAKLRGESAQLKGKFGAMSELLDGAIRSVRKITTQLRPDILDKLGLIAALEWQLQEFRRRTGIRCSFASALTEVSLGEAQATALFRIFQETLTNVARHSRAKHVKASLETAEGRITLKVRDDGVGIEPEKIADFHSLGLLGMQERAAALGGSVFVRRIRTRGTMVSASLPLAGADEASEFRIAGE